MTVKFNYAHKGNIKITGIKRLNVDTTNSVVSMDVFDNYAISADIIENPERYNSSVHAGRLLFHYVDNVDVRY